MPFVAPDSTLQEQMDAVLAAVPATVWVTGADLRFQVSRGFVPRRGGLSHEEMIGRHVDDYLGPELAHVRPFIREALDGRRTTFSSSRENGLELENFVGPLRDGDDADEVIGVVGVTIDVTERNRLLKERDDRLRLMLDQVPAFLWTTDRDLRVTELLGEASRAKGLTPVGTTLCEFWGPDDPVGAVAVHRRAVEGESVEDESELEGRVLVSHLEPLRDAQCEIVGVVGVAFDVTTERELQRSLGRARKLEALGRLAGGIAHDFNNMIFGIKGYIDLALAHTADPTVRTYLESAGAGALRSADLTQQLLAFSRDETVAPRLASPADLIRVSTGLLTGMVGPEFALEVTVADALPNILIDPTQFEQALTNLVANARDAMPGGGTIRVTAAARHIDRWQTAVANDLHAGTWIELSVEDHGGGMGRATVDLVFEPLFTTKQSGHGLGLATVFRVMQQAGGGIVVDSMPGVGTAMRLYFPVREH